MCIRERFVRVSCQIVPLWTHLFVKIFVFELCAGARGAMKVLLGIGVRERKWEMAERVHRTQIGLLRPNANPNVFVPEKEIVPEKLYQKNCTINSGR